MRLFEVKLRLKRIVNEVIYPKCYEVCNKDGLLCIIYEDINGEVMVDKFPMETVQNISHPHIY